VPSSYPNPAADEVLVAYFTTLLSNPAVTGLTPQIPWSFINPNDPGPDPFHSAANAYAWNSLDDVFIAVDRWNDAHRGSPPKTIQLIVSPGFNSPSWVFSNIDNSVCGWHDNCVGAGSCDGLFMAPVQAVSSQCGYTTIFFKSEGAPVEQIPLPLPWNSIYKRDWWMFLAALDQRIQQEPSSSAFVSISMGGPTASSTEMNMPSAKDQGPYTCTVGLNQYLSLNETLIGPPNNLSPICPLTLPGFEVSTAWNLLFKNYYGPNSNYQNSDLPFIEEWDATIDVYGLIFSGITLALTPNDDPLPGFPVAASSPLLIPAPGFESDCGNDPLKNLNFDPVDAMSCAAITQILVHFTNPFVGGFNGKSTQGNGLNALDTSIDLGTKGIKWLAATSASGSAPLPGTPFRMSRILGGAQFDHRFSGTNNEVEQEGCPHLSGDCIGPDGTTGSFKAAQGLENVLGLSFFPGTLAESSFCPYTDPSIYGCSSTVDFANWMYSDAPLNYLQVYDTDILYALGLSNCSVANITGNPASPGNPATPPNVSACQVITSDTQVTQTELNLASASLMNLTESATPW
jgi:hypothetical protein